MTGGNKNGNKSLDIKNWQAGDCQAFGGKEVTYNEHKSKASPGEHRPQV